MSTVTVYKPHPDPWHAFREDDPLGDAMAPPSAPYSVSKIAQEAVARYCARSFDLPVTIARMGAAYSDQGGLPVWHLRRDRRRRAGPDPLGSDALQPDPRRRHLRAARAAARRRERAGDDRELGRRRAGERAGVDAPTSASCSASTRRWSVEEIPGASIGSVGDHDEAQRRSPARAASAGATGSAAWRSTSTRTASGRDDMSRLTRDRYPSSDALLAEAMRARPGLATSGRATSARASTCCSRASSATPISSPATDADVIGDLRRRLVNRLEVEAWYRDHPEIDGAPGARTGRHQRAAAHGHHGARQHDVARSAVPLPARVGAGRSRARRRRSTSEATDPRRLQLARGERAALARAARRCTSTTLDATMEDTELLGMAFHGQQYTLARLRLPRLVARTPT